jgi:plasmid stabilization system protein ParE
MRDLQQIRDFIGEDNPSAAVRFCEALPHGARERLDFEKGPEA